NPRRRTDMAAPTMPRKVPMNGKQSFWLVPTIANLSAPTALEINAGINLSCTLLKDGGASLVPTFNKAALDAYLCETDSYEGLDNTTWSMSDLVGGFDPQAAEASDDKLAFEFLRDGFTGFVVVRNGVPADAEASEVTAGQFVNGSPVEITEAVDISS